MTDQQLNAPGESPTNARATFLASHDVECPTCGYNLRGVTRPTCPECGRELRLNELRSNVVVLRPWIIPAYIAVLAIAIVPMALWYATRGRQMGAQLDTLEVAAQLSARVVPLGIPALIWFNHTRRRWARWRQGAFVHRWSCHVLLLLCLCVTGRLDVLGTLIRYAFMTVPDEEWQSAGLAIGLVQCALFLVCYVKVCTMKSPDRLAEWTMRSIAVIFAVSVFNGVWGQLWFVFD